MYLDWENNIAKYGRSQLKFYKPHERIFDVAQQRLIGGNQLRTNTQQQYEKIVHFETFN